MARRPRTTLSTPAKWLAGVLVAVLAIATVVLVVLAIERTRPVAPDESPEPVPSFSFAATASATPAPSPTVSATPAAAEATVAPAAGRFLSVGSGAMWRATDGGCGELAPVIERSVDGGITWSDVTPAYRDIAGLTSLDSFAGTQAEIVASMGAACETQALRTFTQGEFWAPYPEVLAASRYLDPADGVTAVTPQGRFTAPCAAPSSLRAQGEIVAVLCDGAVSTLADATWTLLPATDVVALAAANGELLTASLSPGCEGVALTRWSGADLSSSAPLGCAPAIDPAAPLAIAADGDAVVLWSADTLTRLG